VNQLYLITGLAESFLFVHGESLEKDDEDAHVLGPGFTHKEHILMVVLVQEAVDK
jgi:hypothetical protein